MAGDSGSSDLSATIDVTFKEPTSPSYIAEQPRQQAEPVNESSPAADGAPEAGGGAFEPPHIHEVARAKTVAHATNLNKYVPESERTIPARRIPGRGADDETHEQVLEQHLIDTSVMEIRVALDNRFLPLMMVPEAAAYSAAHQTR